MTTLFNSDDSKTVQVLTVILAQNWCLPQHSALHPLNLHSFKFTLKIFTALPRGCCPLRRSPFYYLVHIHTHSLIPKPKTMVIDVGVRLVHMGKLRVDQNTKPKPYPYIFLHYSCTYLPSSVYHPYLVCVVFWQAIFKFFYISNVFYLLLYKAIGSGRYVIIIFFSVISQLAPKLSCLLEIGKTFWQNLDKCFSHHHSKESVKQHQYSYSHMNFVYSLYC